MKFSEYFNISRKASDDWFDPDLHIDTLLFLDPYLLWEEEQDPSSPWTDAHGQLLEHFKQCYNLVGRGGGPRSLSAQVALALLKFPEPHEFCLGYTSASTRGSGGGEGRARQMMDGIAVAIRAGITEPEHIEEVGFLTPGIGADSISDATCNVLKARFIRYTEGVAAEHGIETRPCKVRNGKVDLKTGRWMSVTADLPVGPGGRPVLLVPDRFLNDLPVLNADDWFESSLNSDLRRSLNVSVASKVSKRTLVDLARKHPDRISRWANHVWKNGLGSSYDMDDDPKGLVQWQDAGREHAGDNPLGLKAVSTQQDLEDFVDEVIDQFRHFVEQLGGWSLLWNKSKDKPEAAPQLLLLGLSRAYCRLHNVELDREVEMGRGPVDFKLSSGPSVRVLIEVKKLHNTKFWDGLRTQLPIYMRSDKCSSGRLLALRYFDRGVTPGRLKDVPADVAKVVQDTGLDIRLHVVDARRPPSASKA